VVDINGLKKLQLNSKGEKKKKKCFMVHPKRLLAGKKTKQQKQKTKTQKTQNCNKVSAIFTKLLPSVHFNQFNETIFLYFFICNRNFNSVHYQK